MNISNLEEVFELENSVFSAEYTKNTNDDEELEYDDILRQKKIERGELYSDSDSSDSDSDLSDAIDYINTNTPTNVT